MPTTDAMTSEVTISSFLPDRHYLRELLRPWKLATFGVGMSWLLYGAVCYGISDWDIGISLIMGGVTYVFAPWSVTTLSNAVRLRTRGWPLHLVAAFIPALFAVDWAYWLYHTAVGNRMLRWENFKTSMAFYFLCGIFWCFPGSLKELVWEFKKFRADRKTGQNSNLH